MVDKINTACRKRYGVKAVLADWISPLNNLAITFALGTCQEIGLVTFMFFFELSFPYVPSSISFYVSLTNLFSIISFPYLLITRDIQEEGKARFRFY